MFKLSQLAGFGADAITTFTVYSQNVVENYINSAVIKVTGATNLSTTDQEQWMFSGWFDWEADVGNPGYLFNIGNKLYVAFNGSGAVDVACGGTTTGVDSQTSASGVVAKTAGLQHVLVSVDLSRANADKVQVYVDDVDVTMGDLTVTTGSSAAGSTWYFLTPVTPAGNDLYGTAMGDFYLTDESLDMDVTANRRKFIDSGGNPVSLGSNGSTPTGTQPLFLWGGTMAAADWNSGSHLGSDAGTPTIYNTFTDVV